MSLYACNFVLVVALFDEEIVTLEACLDDVVFLEFDGPCIDEMIKLSIIRMLCIYPHCDISPDVRSFFFGLHSNVRLKTESRFIIFFCNFVAELECEHPFIIVIFVDDSLYNVFCCAKCYSFLFFFFF